MVIEATDIEYIKTPNLNYNTFGNDIKSITTQIPLNYVESTTYSVKSDDINISKLLKTSSDKMVTNQSDNDIDKLANTKNIQNKDKVDTKDIQNEDEDKEEDL
ncbi:31250_t:CDS:2 [Gigaspora margarita]|uniref:31250_t:CDS:1 n=1 Tax=Gigaspora margarita TaxID=4874 RepID=A0ABN7UI73_GIGMA|nr:31250_t:CDS:2 [Gigaspora margarita]